MKARKPKHPQQSAQKHQESVSVFELSRSSWFAGRDLWTVLFLKIQDTENALRSKEKITPREALQVLTPFLEQTPIIVLYGTGSRYPLIKEVLHVKAVSDLLKEELIRVKELLLEKIEMWDESEKEEFIAGLRERVARLLYVLEQKAPEGIKSSLYRKIHTRKTELANVLKNKNLSSKQKIRKALNNILHPAPLYFLHGPEIDPYESKSQRVYALENLLRLAGIEESLIPEIRRKIDTLPVGSTPGIIFWEMADAINRGTRNIIEGIKKKTEELLTTEGTDRDLEEVLRETLKLHSIKRRLEKAGIREEEVLQAWDNLKTQPGIHNLLSEIEEINPAVLKTACGETLFEESLPQKTHKEGGTLENEEEELLEIILSKLKRSSFQEKAQRRRKRRALSEEEQRKLTAKVVSKSISSFIRGTTEKIVSFLPVSEPPEEKEIIVQSLIKTALFFVLHREAKHIAETLDEIGLPGKLLKQFINDALINHIETTREYMAKERSKGVSEQELKNKVVLLYKRKTAPKPRYPFGVPLVSLREILKSIKLGNDVAWNMHLSQYLLFFWKENKDSLEERGRRVGYLLLPWNPERQELSIKIARLILTDKRVAFIYCKTAFHYATTSTLSKKLLLEAKKLLGREIRDMQELKDQMAYFIAEKIGEKSALREIDSIITSPPTWCPVRLARGQAKDEFQIEVRGPQDEHLLFKTIIREEEEIDQREEKEVLLHESIKTLYSLGIFRLTGVSIYWALGKLIDELQNWGVQTQLILDFLSKGGAWKFVSRPSQSRIAVPVINFRLRWPERSFPQIDPSLRPPLNTHAWNKLRQAIVIASLLERRKNKEGISPQEFLENWNKVEKSMVFLVKLGIRAWSFFALQTPKNPPTPQQILNFLLLTFFKRPSVFLNHLFFDEKEAKSAELELKKLKMLFDLGILKWLHESGGEPVPVLDVNIERLMEVSLKKEWEENYKNLPIEEISFPSKD